MMINILYTLLSPPCRCRYSLGLCKRTIHVTSSLHIKDYYQILGLNRNATAQQVKSAYYEKAKAHHPDSKKTGSSAQKFQEISDAYQVLSDNDKRRAYDSTTKPQSSRSPFSPSREQSAAPPPRTTVDTMSMSHIHHVYKTLNNEPVEEPKFRFGEDHFYPGTRFNRFEYSRIWDSKSRDWVYMRRKTANKYQEAMASKTKLLNMCLLVFMLGVGLVVFNYNITFENIARQSRRFEREDPRGKYMIVDGKAKFIEKSE